MIQSPTRPSDDVRLAVGAIVFTVFALSFGDALIKQISVDFILWQIFLLRSALAAPLLMMELKRRGQHFMPTAAGWVALRSVMLTAMWVSYYAALSHIPLSIAAAAYYTLPLFITLFAAVFTADPVGPKGWAAVSLGFAGVLLVLRPNAADFNAFALLPVASAVLYALAMILTRTRCQNEHPLVLSLSLNVSFIVVGSMATLVLIMWPPSDALVTQSPFLFSSWSAMTVKHWLAMVVLALVIIIGSIGAAIAYQSGPAPTVATFDFCYLPFAVCWGFAFFGEVPSQSVVAGMVLIVIAGLLAVRR